MDQDTREIRLPVVAGTFYPSHPLQLRTAVKRFLVRETEPKEVIAVVAPHAGYIYSGSTAGKTYASSVLPRRLFVLCPNHTGMGQALAVYPSGSWRTPLGDVGVDGPLAKALLRFCPECRADVTAHLREHAVEVQLPFLQVMLGNPGIVPVAVGTHSLLALQSLGRGLAQAITEARGEAAIVVSSDMNHYEPASVNRRKDDMALHELLALEPERLHGVVLENEITMCGFGPAVAAIVAARALGAAGADVVDYTHSGMVAGGDDEVVSYAGVRIWRSA